MSTGLSIGLPGVGGWVDKINYHILVSPDTSPWLKEAWTGRALPLVQQKETEVSKTKLSHAYGSQLLHPWLFHPSVHPIDHGLRYAPPTSLVHTRLDDLGV